MAKLKIKINGQKYYLLYDSKNIAGKIALIAEQIKIDYQNKKEPPILLAVLTGGLFLAVDLIRQLNKIGLDCHMDTIGLKRYSADEKGGAVEIISRHHANIKNRDLIVVEDIIDNGATMNFLNDYLKSPQHKPASIKYCSLLVRKNHGPLNFKISYCGFEVEPGWITGYGMDSEQALRGLTSIYLKIEA